MKAAFVEKPGPPDAIQVGDLPDPRPQAAQALVRIRAVAVNPVDTYVRAGMMPFQLPLPFVIGCDFAGVVEEVGPEVTRVKAGDRVWGSNQGLLGRQGTFSELAAIDEDWIYPLPEGVEDRTAAAIALVGITAHLGLVQRAGLQPGEKIFVVGGSGGVGSTVVQIAKALGAEVATCAGSDEKCAAARDCGADLAVNYRESDLAEAIEDWSPEGVDVFWETRREPDFDLAIEALAARGRMVLMAGRDARPKFPVGPFYFKQCDVLGFVMFNCTADEQRRCADDISRWLAEGKVRPLIGQVLPLDEAAEAHRIQEENTIHHKGDLAGKIVLDVPG